MTDRLDQIFRIWVLIAPIGVLLITISTIHFLVRGVNPAVFVLYNDPAAWLMLLTGILLIVAGLSRSFKFRVLRLVRQALAWLNRRRTGRG